MKHFGRLWDGGGELLQLVREEEVVTWLPYDKQHLKILHGPWLKDMDRNPWLLVDH